MGARCSDCVSRSREKEEGLASGGMLLPNNSGRHPRQDYIFDRTPVGTGGYGVVRLVTSKRTGQLCAVKMLKKARVNPVLMANEVSINLTLDHPNIVKLFDVYEDKDNIYLVMEACHGGEVLDKILARQPRAFGEGEALGLVGQVLYAVNYLHAKCVAHRDLKLENILLKDDTDEIAGNTAKLIDFGFSKRFTPGQATLHTVAGSAYYVAPEVLAGDAGYNEKCDLWSVGVILYMLLSGAPPFGGKNEADILDSVRNRLLHFPKNEWAGISTQAKHLLRQMLDRDVKQRVSAEEALAELKKIPSVATAAKGTDKNQGAATDQTEAFFTRLRKFGSANRFVQAARHLMVRHMDEKAIEGVRAAFAKLDKNGDGMLSIEEARAGLAQAGIEEGDLQGVFDNIDLDHSKQIDYSEFLAATIERECAAKEALCWEAFRVFDKDNNGRISKSELTEALSDGNAIGVPDPAQIEAIFEEVDADGDGSVDFSEFCQMMGKSYSIKSCPRDELAAPSPPVGSGG